MNRPAILSSQLLALALAVAATSVPLRGGDQPPVPRRSPGVAAPSSPAPAAGWRAFRDPATGKLREPTPEEALELSRRAAARKSAAAVAFEVVVHPDGTKSVDLQDAFAMSLVARRKPDGSISYECRPAAASEKRAARPSAPPEK